LARATPHPRATNQKKKLYVYIKKKKKNLLIYIKNISEGKKKYSETNTPNRPTYQDFIVLTNRLRFYFIFYNNNGSRSVQLEAKKKKKIV
jgi:hypothetical protein